MPGYYRNRVRMREVKKTEGLDRVCGPPPVPPRGPSNPPNFMFFLS